MRGNISWPDSRRNWTFPMIFPGVTSRSSGRYRLSYTTGQRERNVGNGEQFPGLQQSGPRVFPETSTCRFRKVRGHQFEWSRGRFPDFFAFEAFGRGSPLYVGPSWTVRGVRSIFESLQIRHKSPFTITGFWWFAIKTTTVDKFLDILLMPLTCHNKIKCIGTIDITIVCLPL